MPPIGMEGAIHATQWERAAPYLTEFLGTFVLTMTFMCNYAVSSDPVWAATSNGFMVAAMVYACSHVSGANLNPSVTFALALAGRQTAQKAAALCTFQILGSIAAAALRYTISNVTVDIGPHPGFSWFEVGVVEIIYSSMICFVFLNCAASSKNNPISDQNGFSGLALGLCFVAGGYAAREVSHTVMNSAIAVGLGIVDQSDGFSARCVGYLCYDLLGALLGVGAYRVVRPHEFRMPGLSDAQEEHVEESSRVLAEFIGTFYVIFTKALNSMAGIRDPGLEAWSVAAALSAMVYSLRTVSGGHFNPAVTLAALLSGRNLYSRRIALFYVIVQVVAGVAACAIFAIVNHGVELEMHVMRVTSAPTIIAETLFMCMTCYVVLAIGLVAPASSKTRQNNIAGWAYGACRVVGGFAIGNISGSMLNPAVAISFSGLSALHRDLRHTCLPYVLYHAMGSMAAVGLFRVTHAHVYRTSQKGPLKDSSLAEQHA